MYPFFEAEHAAFIRSTQSLAVWTDNVKDLLPHMEVMQTAMMDFLFRPNASLEEKQLEEQQRPTWHQSPILVGLTVGLNILVSALSIRTSEFPASAVVPRS
jgi:hypothetical protein